ncbi:NUDIX hydrolase [Haloplanus aerogenes]|uniref:8-oxo-dGTP pyrophosphatase MutT (NUDIX family) n=1 Tax=Haloplanus aerogenes TaxID=660522 RepID=A0A3M0DP97_9EURY|nr:NUDIX domain-containing protein [Haloplanus aerogenes]AZH24742.1 NUDIX domain-containing protein [Haloplanus aerogenes]RMB23597.1 8-oxo-dGTP pyrophosphatase MutT (NUDIX family) [Haloplanus aerogenes]
MLARDVTYVEKACAYITRDGSEVLVFRGPGHDGFQIPKGTVEPGETPRDAVYREAIEESGLATFERVDHLVTDVWTRRESPPKRYVRHFYHAPVHEPRDSWTHTVTGTGDERGAEFEFSWLDLSADAPFALDLDDYLHTLTGVDGPVVSEVVAD